MAENENEDVTVTERIVRDGVLVAVPGTKLSAAEAARLGVSSDGTKDSSREDVSPYDAPAGSFSGISDARPVEVVGASAPAETANESSGENAAEAAPAKSKA